VLQFHSAYTRAAPAYEGSYIIQKIINSSLFEVKDEEGKCRGLFNLRHLKPYLEEKLSANDKLMIGKKVELINNGVTETVSEQQKDSRRSRIVGTCYTRKH
jgi:hypothetical protein